MRSSSRTTSSCACCSARSRRKRWSCTEVSGTAGAERQDLVVTSTRGGLIYLIGGYYDLEGLSVEGRYEVPDCESDASADRADHHHLKAGTQEGEAGHLTFCDSDGEECEECAGEADRERDVEGEEEVGPERDDRGAEVGGSDDARIAERCTASVGRQSEFLLNLRTEKDVRVRCESAGDRLGLCSGKPFALEDDCETRLPRVRGTRRSRDVRRRSPRRRVVLLPGLRGRSRRPSRSRPRPPRQGPRR